MASISLMGKLGPGTSHHLPSRWGCQLLWVHVRSTYAGGSVYEGLGSSFRGLERGSLPWGVGPRPHIPSSSSKAEKSAMGTSAYLILASHLLPGPCPLPGHSGPSRPQSTSLVP